MNKARLLQTFLDLVRIPSPSGKEEPVAAYAAARLEKLGIASECDAIGNLVARMPGVGESLLLTAHMDTVEPAARITPVVEDGIISTDGTSVLGGDDKSGVAAILEMAEVLASEKSPHRPLEIVFTVQEEVGLHGAKALDISRLQARMAVGLDAGGEPGTIVVQAPSQDSFRAVVHGRESHAGTSPEKGINAIVIASKAILAMPLGRIDAETTANVGIIEGGTATNVVPNLVHISGEARSLNSAKLEALSATMRLAFEHAAADSGGEMEVTVQREYNAYQLSASEPVVALVSQAMQDLGYTPMLVSTGGGSDANVLNHRGVSMVQISTGMQNVHTLQERIALADIASAVQALLRCARMDA